MTSGGATLASIYHTKLKADEMSTGWYYTKNLTSSFFHSSAQLYDILCSTKI